MKKMVSVGSDGQTEGSEGFKSAAVLHKHTEEQIRGTKKQEVNFL